MSRRGKTLEAPFEARTVTVSGTTYKAANLADYPLKPVSHKTIGGLGGARYEYRIENSHAYWDLVNHLAEAACRVADEEGDQSYRMLAIYSDLKKI